VSNYGPDDIERFVREIIMPFDTLQISIAHLAGAGGFRARTQACFERLIALCGPDTPYASRVWTDTAATLLATTTADEARRFGELLPRWGLHRILWGSDNIHDALESTRIQWPLEAAAWHRIAEQRGDALVAQGMKRSYCSSRISSEGTLSARRGLEALASSPPGV